MGADVGKKNFDGLNSLLWIEWINNKKIMQFVEPYKFVVDE